MADEDDFTAEELERFEAALKDEEQMKLMERFGKWRGQKANPGNQRPADPPPSSPSGGKTELTLSQLREMVADKPTRSILKHLSEAAEALEANPPQSGNNPPQNKKPDAQKGGLKKLFL